MIVCNSWVCIFLILLILLICIIQILGQDTEPEDLSIRSNVVEKYNDINFFGLDDIIEAQLPTSERKK